MVWALIPRWLRFAGLGVILAAGAAFWIDRRAYNRGVVDERLKADQARVVAAQTVRTEKAAAVAEAFRQGAASVRTATALRDSVAVRDTVTLMIPGPALTPVAIVVPAIVVRRIVADSLAMRSKDAIIATQGAQIVADSLVILAHVAENATLREMKAPKCGGKCKAVAVVTTVVVASEAAVRIVRLFRR